MLLSDRIRLIAAFDHRHIFLDPDPDPAISFAERKRLFALPRSSWDDYDRSKISPGGGVWPRTAKRIPLSAEARRALGTEAEMMTANELVSAILKAPVDLLWNGGIGTFVKARSESHADAQDRSNDAVRVDAEDLRCRVVAEGGNLGFTQRARIAYALRGGRINTDFIDNSAGVDCSDHEVNIKILLGHVMEAGELTRPQRDRLLAEMTDEVAELVLRDNKLQNFALSIGQLRAAERLDAQLRLIRKLEARGRLDRTLESLPSDEEIALRRERGLGLTRPEAAVLLAYAKIALFDDLLLSGLPGRAYFAGDLRKYFPRPLRRRFAAYIEQHPLRREIIATWLANSIVNRGLEVFVSELEDDTGADLTEIALGFVVARDALGLIPIWTAVEALGREVSAAHQLALLDELRSTLVRATRWFIAHGPKPLVIRDAVRDYRPGILSVISQIEDLLGHEQLETFAATIAGWREAGLGSDLAREVASLPYRLDACDIVAAARQHGSSNGSDSSHCIALARIYFALVAELGISWLRSRLQAAPIASRWDRLALNGLEDQLSALLRRLAVAALTALCDEGAPEALPERLRRWLAEEVHGIGRYRRVLAELEAGRTVDLAMLTVAVRALSALDASL
jgi:glutamate dehydrogenase